ncbi:Hint domain-containing protein, partial [Cribrihabitans sp. XS_ASV171]
STDTISNLGPAVYTGYSVTASNGSTYAVFQSGDGSLFIPYNKADFDLAADLPGTVSTTFVGDDFTATGNPVCFAAGTLIATPEGETTVETLKIGDLVTTADGRSVPVKWIGRQTVHKLFTPAERFTPVRVRAGALGDGLPHTDLVLTADHALILDGLAINAGALVNGTSIAWEPMDSLPERVTYYHVETEDHDVILANGAPAETYVDYVQRRVFDNHAEYLDLYGEERTIREMALPRVSSARLVPASILDRIGGSE